MGRRLVLGLAAAGGVAAIAFLAVVLARQGVERAGTLAGVIGALASVVAAVAAVWGPVGAAPGARAATVPGSGGGVDIGHAGPSGNDEHHVAVQVAGGSYMAQVRRIAPPVLAGRVTELAELAAFCLEPDQGPYAWWRARPWAGKSALLSWFVLSPPPEVAERVRFAAFFITARLASQDTRQAFTDAMLDQLAALAGEELPTVLPGIPQEWCMLGLMERAARSCQEAGGRLVLVVDGLDEDRGTITGPDAHSIAGLLPADPPAGMRVIVTGRPNPPVPDDVPDWHPLRDPAIIRELAESPYARDLQRLGNQELKRLLKGAARERDVLGLLAAARGGLSARDLTELARVPLWEVEEILGEAAGRTFARRPARWAPAVAPDVYLLGHEELHVAAARCCRSFRRSVAASLPVSVCMA